MRSDQVYDSVDDGNFVVLKADVEGERFAGVDGSVRIQIEKLLHDDGVGGVNGLDLEGDVSVVFRGDESWFEGEGGGAGLRHEGRCGDADGSETFDEEFQFH